MSGTLGKTAAVACLAGACAGSSPQTRMTSPEAECPPGSVERLDALDYWPGLVLAKDSTALVNFPTHPWVALVPLPPEGPVTIYVFRNFPDRNLAKVFPRGTKFHGRLFHGQSRYFAWFTEAETPDGNRVAVCLQTGFDDGYEPMKLGMHYDDSSTPERTMVDPFVQIYAARHLGRL